MSTTNSHLQKILAQVEQELTAADYNTELEAVPKHQAPLSIQATQLITSAPRRPPDIQRLRRHQPQSHPTNRPEQRR